MFHNNLYIFGTNKFTNSTQVDVCVCAGVYVLCVLIFFVNVYRPLLTATTGTHRTDER